MIPHPKSVINFFILFMLLTSLLGSAVFVTPVYAAGFFTVTKTADTADGTCNSDCSLREAITAANSNGPDADTIMLPAGIYTLTLGVQLPFVNSILAIQGDSAANTIIQAKITPNTATYRIFEVTNSLTLDSLTVRNGSCSGGACATDLFHGGAIYNAGTLTVIDSAFSANTSVSGGAIFNDNAALIVTNCTFSSNSAVNRGGGIFNDAGSLTVTGGAFSTNSAGISGGGLYNGNSSFVTLTNTAFSSNTATSGGGMYNNLGNPSLTNVTFSNNLGITQNNVSGSGGGMGNDQGDPTLTNVTFSGNSAFSGGGMVNFNSSNPTLTSVTFNGNSAFLGAGISNQNSAGVLMNVIFSGNTVNISGNGGGGGMYNLNSSPTLTNVSFVNNSAITSGYGGGIYNNSNSSPILMNITFSGNSANYGGGVYNKNSSPTFTNTTFSGNSATNQGGGMYNLGGSPTLKNTTFSGNTSVSNGGGMSNAISSPHIFNSIFWGNGAVEIDNQSTGMTMIYSIVQGGCPAGSSLCSGVLNANPYLGVLQNNGGFTQTLALGTASAAIDKGDNGTCAPKDQRGVLRPQGIYCDIGSYEYKPSERAKNGGFNIYVATAKIPTNWTAANFASTDGKFTTAKKEGTASVKIAGQTGKTKTLTQTFLLSGTSGNTFTFSFWVKGASIPTLPSTNVCRGQVLFYNDSTLKLTKTINCPAGTYAFQKKTLTFNTTSAYTKVVIKFTYSKPTGTVWFDLASLLR